MNISDMDAIMDRVARLTTLAPITSDPSEWIDIGDVVHGEVRTRTWQNTRQGSCFSTDGGKTYYDIDADDSLAFRRSKDPTQDDE